ncbi:hypothetical protein N2152v2_007251 [Parachlorella kessleri]
MTEDSAGPSPKRQRVDDIQSAADVAYEPKALCDFIIETADGRKLAVHRAFILRYSAFFGKLLEATPADKVPVTETAEDFQGHFLDLLYDRNRELQPQSVLRVLELADKYESASLIRACRATLCSKAFVLTLRKPGLPPVTLECPPGDAAVRTLGTEVGHCSVLDALLLASKYDFEDLLARVEKFVTQQASDKLILLFLTTTTSKEKLQQVKPQHLARVLQAVAGASYRHHAATDKQRLAFELEKAGWEKERAKLQKAVATEKERSEKTLRRFNQLLAKAQKHGIQAPP